MSCYLTVEKFKASPYYCSFPKCCEPENIDQTIEDLIEESVGLIDSFIPDKYQAKDFSDLVKLMGKEAANHILFYETLIPF